MAKKKDNPAETSNPLPPEDDLHRLEVLPGVLISVHPAEEFHNEGEYASQSWPPLAATAPVVGDWIHPIDDGPAGEVVRRAHGLTSLGPVVFLYVRIEE